MEILKKKQDQKHKKTPITFKKREKCQEYQNQQKTPKIAK